MAVSPGGFRSLTPSLRTKDPGIGALCPSPWLLRGGRMGGEPSGFGRNPRGEEQDLICGVLAAAIPRSRRGLVGPVLIGGSGLSPRCRFPRPGRDSGPGSDDGRTRGHCRTRSDTADAENSKGPTLCVGPFTRAVAEGFEPSVSFPTLAFEASSFGRSDTLPRESLDHLGRPSKSDSAQDPATTGTPGQRSRKKAVRRAAQSASRTPWTTSGRWLRRRSRTTSQSEPAAPAFSSRAP